MTTKTSGNARTQVQVAKRFENLQQMVDRAPALFPGWDEVFEDVRTGAYRCAVLETNGFGYDILLVSDLATAVAHYQSGGFGWDPVYGVDLDTGANVELPPIPTNTHIAELWDAH
jgi:hypothetical protein